MNPPSAIAALHHLHVVVVVLVALLAERTEVSLLTKAKAVAAHGQIANELRHVCRSARFALQARSADQRSVGAEESLAGAQTRRVIILLALLTLHFRSGRHVARVADCASWAEPIQSLVQRHVVASLDECPRVARDVHVNIVMTRVEGRVREVVCSESNIEFVFDTVIMIRFTAAHTKN